MLGRSREVFSHDRSYGCGVFRVSMEFVYMFSHVSFDHMIICIIIILLCLIRVSNGDEYERHPHGRVCCILISNLYGIAY